MGLRQHSGPRAVTDTKPNRGMRTGDGLLRERLVRLRLDLTLFDSMAQRRRILFGSIVQDGLNGPRPVTDTKPDRGTGERMHSGDGLQRERLVRLRLDVALFDSVAQRGRVLLGSIVQDGLNGVGD